MIAAAEILQDFLAQIRQKQKQEELEKSEFYNFDFQTATPRSQKSNKSSRFLWEAVEKKTGYPLNNNEIRKKRKSSEKSKEADSLEDEYDNSTRSSIQVKKKKRCSLQEIEVFTVNSCIRKVANS